MTLTPFTIQFASPGGAALYVKNLFYSAVLTITLALFTIEPRSAEAGDVIFACGRNDSGQLGIGTTIEQLAPVPCTGFSDIRVVSSGILHSCAVKVDGTVWTWGLNQGGELGLGYSDNAPHPVPMQVPGLSEVVSVAAGPFFNCFAIRANGTLWAWGRNYQGSLGDGTLFDRNAPVQVVGLTSVIAVAPGTTQTVALKSDGTVWAWGYNENGNVGDGATTDRLTPVQVVNLTGVIAIASYFQHSLALKSDGTVWAWGLNHYGQLGNGAAYYGPNATPAPVVGLTGIRAIACGAGAPGNFNNPGGHGLALKFDGTLWAWGDNINGQLGDGTQQMRTLPVQVQGLSGVTAIAAGERMSLALKADGTAWAWGSNSYGQIGDGTTTQRSLPVRMIGLDTVASVSCGGYHTLVRRMTPLTACPGDVNNDGLLNALDVQPFVLLLLNGSGFCP